MTVKKSNLNHFLQCSHPLLNVNPTWKCYFAKTAWRFPRFTVSALVFSVLFTGTLFFCPSCAHPFFYFDLISYIFLSFTLFDPALFLVLFLSVMTVQHVSVFVYFSGLWKLKCPSGRNKTLCICICITRSAHLSLINPQKQGPHLSCPEKGLDVVWLQGQNVPACLQRLGILLQFELSGGQVVQTLHPVVPHLLFLCLRAVSATICTQTRPHNLW